MNTELGWVVMAGPEDVLPLSEHLHTVTPGWPAAPGGPQLVQLTRAGHILDAARRCASALAYPQPAWPATPQPVGRLYREEGVRAILSWLRGLLERLRAEAELAESLVELEHL